jgi:hypothetical protein
MAYNVPQAGLVPLSGYLKVRKSNRNYKTQIRGISLAWCYAMPSQVLGDVRWLSDPTSPCYFKVFFLLRSILLLSEYPKPEERFCAAACVVSLSKQNCLVNVCLCESLCVAERRCAVRPKNKLTEKLLS